jgi:hypothetical protein
MRWKKGGKKPHTVAFFGIMHKNQGENSCIMPGIYRREALDIFL